VSLHLHRAGRAVIGQTYGQRGLFVFYKSDGTASFYWAGSMRSPIPTRSTIWARWS